MERNARQARRTPRWLIWLRAIRPWLPLATTLGMSLTMLGALAAILLRVRGPLRTVAEWTLIISAAGLGIGRLADAAQEIRLDPEKRERFNRAWHTIGARILLAGFIVLAAGMLTACTCVLIGEWTGNLPKDTTVVALVVALIGFALLFVGLVAFVIEDAMRESRWPGGRL